MRGTDQTTGSLFSYVDLEARVPGQHPLRAIRMIVTLAVDGTVEPAEAPGVVDDGVGIDAGDGAGTPGLGTGIVDALAKQLGATVTTSDMQPCTKVLVERAA